jgi:type III secretion protein D
VSGVVPGDADRLRVQRALEAAQVDADLAVLTASGLSRAVADVARLNGIQAEARPQRDGGVVLATPPIDDRTRDRLAQVVRRDVPGLTALRFSEEIGEPRTVSEATKRVASVVTGDPPYILTEDGARYFAGALLPSGYRLVAIDGNRVRLDRRGKTLTLQF